MRDEAGRSPTTTDDDLLRALRSLGLDHEPDELGIRRRIGVGASKRSARAAGRTRPGRPSVILSTAALVVVVGGVMAAVRMPERIVESSAPTQVASSSPAAPSVSSSPRSAVGDAVSATAPRPTTPPESRRPRSSASGKPESPESSSGAVTVQRLSAGATRAVAVGGEPVLDWVVVGARSDLKQQRSKAAGVSPVIFVDQPAAAERISGPFSVSWTGGTPEQSRDDARTWLAQDAGAGLTLALAPATRERTVTLYAGAGDADASLSMITAASTTKTPLGSFDAARGVVVTVRVPATVDTVTLYLSGTAHTGRADSARVFLSTVIAE